MSIVIQNSVEITQNKIKVGLKKLVVNRTALEKEIRKLFETEIKRILAPMCQQVCKEKEITEDVFMGRFYHCTPHTNIYIFKIIINIIENHVKEELSDESLVSYDFIIDDKTYNGGQMTASDRIKILFVKQIKEALFRGMQIIKYLYEV